MIRLAHLFSASVALLVLGGAVARAEPSGPAAQGGDRALHQPGLLLLPARRRALRRVGASNPDLIALTLPVTYWDYLGWKDTLGKDSFAKRQKFYAKARGDGQVYTPQAVINGASHVVGSDKVEIERAVKQPPGTGFVTKVSLKEEAGHAADQARAAGRAGGAHGRRLGRGDDAHGHGADHARREPGQDRLLRQCRARHDPHRGLGRQGSDADRAAHRDAGPGRRQLCRASSRPTSPANTA